MSRGSRNQSFDVNSFLAKTLTNYEDEPLPARKPRASVSPRAKSLPPLQAKDTRPRKEYTTSCSIININNNNNHNYQPQNNHNDSVRPIIGRQHRRHKTGNQQQAQNKRRRNKTKDRCDTSPKRTHRSNMRPNVPQNVDDTEQSRLLDMHDANVAGNSAMVHSVSNQRLPNQMLSSSVMANVSCMTPSVSKSSLISGASSVRPSCRICQMGTSDGPSDALISPCRCSGSMLFVHTSCLVHWLEISTRKMCPTPQCELCGYEYKTHHCLRLQKLHMPRCSARDKVLHIVFVAVLLVMIACASLCVMYLKNDPGGKLRTTLDSDDIIVITCSVLFFCAFFIAVFTQYRAEASICRLFFRSWLINKHWRIRNYDQKDDWQRNQIYNTTATAIKTDV